MLRTPAPPPSPKRHLMTIAVEDYFQVVAFRRLIDPNLWYRFERRIERNTHRALDLLDEFGVKATFFALGWVAEEMPEIIREIAARGHEVASKGHYHRTIQEMTPGEFREDVQRSREAIERATGIRVIGYRIARGHLGPADLWALDVLAEEGFDYDSSFYPRLGSIAHEPWRRFRFSHHHAGRELSEFPMATWGRRGWLFPIAGGAYLRHLPHALISHALEDWHRRYASPLVMYFHIWELDSELPKITAASALTRLRQYRNLEQMPSILRFYLSRYAFEPIRDHMRIAPQAAVPCETTRHRSQATAIPEACDAASRTAATVVIPCFNEESVLPYLGNTLERLASTLGATYDLRYVFVDDGSSDGTWTALQKNFGTLPNCQLVRHEANRGVAAAILTGIRSAETEVVCSMDCDCTYDPQQLGDLIPKLEGDVALVTASPYHPSGRVLNVPAWRLVLSKGLSALYRRVFVAQLHTYTSCLRVYRRSQVRYLELREGGFLGVAEFLMLLDLEGKRIVEHPAVLEVRLLGHSKMKLFRTIRGHLGLLWRMAVARQGSRKGRDSVSHQKE
jgi:polysaccharide deacetylase family protein (PEP-CTERM system associated)